MRCIPRLAIVLAVAAAISSCFQVKQLIRLKKDFSGEAEVAVTINMEPMAYTMAQTTKAMSGNNSPVTEAEFEQAKKEMLAQQKTGATPFDEKQLQAEMSKSLPEGVRLVEVKSEEKGLETTVRMRFSFQHVRQLAEVKIQNDQASGSGLPGQGSPFEGLRVVEEGDTLLVENAMGGGKVDEVKAMQSQFQAGGTTELDKRMEKALKDIRFTFEIEAPMAVIEHNAARKQGGLLTWEWDLAALEKLASGGPGVRVKFKKS